MHYTPANFRFDPVREQHLLLLHEWLTRPHVARWWRPTPSLDALRHDYLADAAEGAARGYIAVLRSQPIGFVQCYTVVGCGEGWWEQETDPGARGIDQFLAESSVLGKGLGAAMVRSFVEGLFARPEVTVVQTDPHPANERAIRSYMRAGFRPAGRITTPDGPALLMRRTRSVAARE